MKKYEVSLSERISYALGDVGCNFIWTTVASFLTLYYTDSVGISAGVVGTIMLVTRLLDGLTDLGMGMILDRTNTRWGKARPWILWSAPFMSLGLIALFSVPAGLGDTGKTIYAVITYVFVAAFAYTASNLAFNTLISLMTADQQSRISANSIRFICTGVIIITISYITTPLVRAVGWTWMATIYGALALICFLITFFGVRERCSGVDGSNSDRDKVGGLKAFKLLFKNRYFITIAIIFIMYYIGNSIFSTMGIYYVRDILHDQDLYGTITLFTRVPMMLTLITVPKLVDKYGKWKCMIVGFILMALGHGIMLISTTNTVLVVIGLIIRGAGTGPIMSGIFSLVADAVDYGEWKTGVRQAGLTNSATSFGMKVGTGLGSAICGWGLALGGYDANEAVQSAQTLSAEVIMFVALPILIIIICMISLYFTNIDKIYPKIRKELDERLSKRKN